MHYKPEYEDLLALARHQVATSPALQQRLRRLQFGYAIAFSLLAIGAYLTLGNLAASFAFAFATLASISILAYPSLFRWKLNGDLPEIVRRRATPSSFAARTLQPSPEGLEQVSNDFQSKVGWAYVDGFLETPKYTFISIEGPIPWSSPAIVFRQQRTTTSWKMSVASALPPYNSMEPPPLRSGDLRPIPASRVLLSARY